jgi:hypothetical protein
MVENVDKMVDKWWKNITKAKIMEKCQNIAS